MGGARGGRIIPGLDLQRMNGQQESPRRIRDLLLEYVARKICARYNECQPTDGYCDAHWPSFRPAAEEALAGIQEFDSGARP